jgi:hypothetical protein
MSWSTPKTNWTSGEFFTYADYNRITENIDYLYAYCNTNIGYIGTPYTFTTKTVSDYLNNTGYNEVHDALRYLYDSTGASFTHDPLLDKTPYSMPWGSAELNNIENMCLELKNHLENFDVEYPFVMGNTLVFPASWVTVTGNTLKIVDTYGVYVDGNMLRIPERP